MDTVIRTKPTWWRCALVLGATAIFHSIANGAELEIHVSTGPDGIEIFSNLPRGPLAAQGVLARPAKDQVVFVVASDPFLDISGGQGSDMEMPGKSFLQDD